MVKPIWKLWIGSFCRFRTNKNCRCATEETAKGKRVLKTREWSTKKSSGILCGKVSECVKIAKKYFSQRKISTVCRILGVSRSSYYRQAKEQKEEEKQLEQHIISTFAKHKGNYGRIRIKKALEREHIKAGRINILIAKILILFFIKKICNFLILYIKGKKWIDRFAYKCLWLQSPIFVIPLIMGVEYTTLYFFPFFIKLYTLILFSLSKSEILSFSV